MTKKNWPTLYVCNGCYEEFTTPAAYDQHVSTCEKLCHCQPEETSRILNEQSYPKVLHTQFTKMTFLQRLSYLFRYTEKYVIIVDHGNGIYSIRTGVGKSHSVNQ